MITHISGTCIASNDQSLTIDVHGLGYEVFSVPEVCLHYEPSDTVSLHTYLAVRETSMELFGFSTQSQLDLFKLLITISGIGPRSALQILGIESVEKLSAAIRGGDVGYLTRVSGIGKKTAEKIILELREKMGALKLEEASQELQEETDIVEALVALGYHNHHAREALQSVSIEIEGTNARIKAALQYLASSK